MAFCLLRCAKRGLLSGIGSKDSWVLLEKECHEESGWNKASKLIST